MRRTCRREKAVQARTVAEVADDTRRLHLYKPESLAGIERLTHLEYLKVTTDVALDGMEEIARLPRLETLIWWEEGGLGLEAGDPGLDLAPIAASRSLTKLDIWHYKVTNLDALCDMTQLEYLWLKGPYGDARMERLGRLKNLRFLRGRYDGLGGAQAIRHLTALRHLDLCSVPAGVDLRFLGDLSHLEELDLGMVDDGHVDLPYLPKVRALQVMRGFFPCDPTTFGCLPELESLTLGRWKAADYSALAGLPHLNEFSVDASDATSTKGLERCVGLTSLRIPLPADCGDLSWCRSLHRLNGLALHWAFDVQSLCEVAGLPELKTLTLWNASGLTTLADLPAESRLTELHLDSVDSLQSLEGIEALTGLSKLRISGLPGVPDVAPLIRLARLKEVGLFLRELRDCIYVPDPCANYHGTAELDALAECPSLVAVKLDCFTRATETEAKLALRRRDVPYVRKCRSSWADTMLNSSFPERTLPILLGVMAELLEPDDLSSGGLGRARRQLEQWKQTVIAAEEILGEL